LVEGGSFSDLERAEVFLALGICRYQLNSVQTALGLLNEALGLAERSGLPSDQLRSDILSWRSRCWRRHRDYEAAREDIERALQLAEDANDPRTIGAAYFQASLVADREGHWVLARTYAEKARTAYEQLADRVHVGQLTNNLGGLNFLLGNTDEAISLRSRRGMRWSSSSGSARRTTSRRSATRSSCSVGRSSSRAVSTRPSRRSRPPRPTSGSSALRAIARRSGSPAAISRHAVATTGLPPISTARRQRLSRIFGSND